jgi:glycerol-3-phosphate dehydrogenase (NAD(P)+)
VSGPATQLEPRIGILGDTHLGRGLARLVAGGGRAVTLWAHDPTAPVPADQPPLPAGVELTDELAVAARPDVLVLCVPAHVARPVARALGEVARGDQVLVHAARGLEASSGLTVSAVVQEESCLRKIGVLGGALRSRDLERGRVVAAVVASRFEEVLQRVAAVLRGPSFRVLASQDLVGVELAGAYRSIAAVWIGIVEALRLGPAVRAMVTTEGLSEAARLGARLGADPLTFTGYAGIGDLVATVADPAGREHEAGALLVKGPAAGTAAALVPEAAAAAAGACVLAARVGVKAFGAEGLRRLLIEGGDADVMLRAVLDEISAGAR